MYMLPLLALALAHKTPNNVSVAACKALEAASPHQILTPCVVKNKKLYEAARKHHCALALRSDVEARIVRAGSGAGVSARGDIVARAWLGPACPYDIQELEAGVFMLWSGATARRVRGARHALVPVSHWKSWTCPATVAVDVGAGMGDTTVPIAKSVGPDGVVRPLGVHARVHPILTLEPRS